MPDISNLTYEAFSQAAGIIDGITEGQDATGPLLHEVLAEAEAHLETVIPGLAGRMSGCWEKIREAGQLAEVLCIAYSLSGTASDRIWGFSKRYDDECAAARDGEYEDPPEVEYLPRDTYLQFREVYFRLSGNDKTLSRKTKDIELTVLHRSPEEVAEMSALFESPIDISDHTAFKRLDKDRTGTISPAELLRALLPGVSKHSIKHAMRLYERPWKHFKQQLLEEAREAKEVADREEAEEAEEEEAGDGEGEEPVVVTGEVFLFCKEAFESIDSDGSGAVSHGELGAFLEENPSPFVTEKPNFKSMDKDRSGYVSFLEFVRAVHPETPVWRIKKDIRLNEAKYGAVAVEVTTKPSSTKKAGLPVVTKGLSLHKARLAAFDQKIRALEEVYQRADKDLRTFHKARERARAHLSPDGQHALTQKLYYQQVEKRVEAEGRRAEALEQQQVASRWINHSKLTQDDVLTLNQRLYDEQVAACGAKRAQLSETYIAEPAPSRTIEHEDLQLSIQRLYSTEVALRSDKRSQLISKHRHGPRTRTLSPELCAEQASRLYTGGMKRKAEALAHLQKKYVDDSQLPRMRLGKAQQKQMVERLHG